jgi:hypothetical protein
MNSETNYIYVGKYIYFIMHEVEKLFAIRNG